MTAKTGKKRDICSGSGAHLQKSCCDNRLHLRAGFFLPGSQPTKVSLKASLLFPHRRATFSAFSASRSLPADRTSPRIERLWLPRSGSSKTFFDERLRCEG